MKYLDVRRVTLENLRLPPDWQERLDAPRNREFAAALKSTSGPIHPPVVDAARMEIVAGTDRIAAMVIGGETEFDVRMWLGSDAELRMLRASENLHRRRDDEAMWLGEYQSAYSAVKAERAAELPDKCPENAPPKTRGRKKTDRGEAREAVAALTGRSPEAIRKAEERAARKADPLESDEPVPPGPMDPEFHDAPRVKPEPLAKRLERAAELVAEAHALVTGVVEEMRPLMDAASEQDGRWRVWTLVSEAHGHTGTATLRLPEAVKLVKRAKTRLFESARSSGEAPPPVPKTKPRCHCAAHQAGHDEGCPWREPEPQQPLITNLGEALAAAEGPRVGLGGARLDGGLPPQSRAEKRITVVVQDEPGGPERQVDPFADPDEGMAF